MSLSEAEKTFILHGIADNYRLDGRNREAYRPMELETDIVQHAFGSARLRLANTDILVAVKIEMDTPLPEKPFEGKIEFFVDCSANATPDFEGRGGEDLAIKIVNILSSAYASQHVLDLRKLCVLEKRKCWKLYVDILILECGGNLYDAISLAVKAALFNTQVPKVQAVKIDGDNVEIDVSDNVSDCEKLNIENTPVLVTVCKIGDYCIVDPCILEEKCTAGSVVVAVSNNYFSSICTIGMGSLQEETLIECLDLGHKVAIKLNKALKDILKEIKPNQDIGFLK